MIALLRRLLGPDPATVGLQNQLETLDAHYSDLCYRAWRARQQTPALHEALWLRQDEIARAEQEQRDEEKLQGSLGEPT